jgi:hypothetical protein
MGPMLFKAVCIIACSHEMVKSADQRLVSEDGSQTGSRPAFDLLTRYDPLDVFGVNRGSLLAPTFRPLRRRHGQSAMFLLAGL